LLVLTASKQKLLCSAVNQRQTEEYKAQLLKQVFVLLLQLDAVS